MLARATALWHLERSHRSLCQLDRKLDNTVTAREEIAHVASGKSSHHASCEGLLRIPLQLVPGPRSSSGAQAGTSGFLSSADMDLGHPMEFQQGIQALSRVETCKSAFLSSCNSIVKLPVELT